MPVQAPEYSDRVLRIPGTRTPEGTMWALQRDHFFQYHGHRVSRSMVELAGRDALGSFKKYCDKHIFETPEPSPARVATWSEARREGIQTESRNTPPSSSSGSSTAVNTPATERDALFGDWGKKGVWSIPASDLKLEEHIPLNCLPDTLIVEDPYASASFHGDRASHQVRYRLVTSTSQRVIRTPASACLRLSSNRLPSSGSHKLLQGLLRLPNASQELSVIAKVASGADLTLSRQKLANEADVFMTKLPPFLAEDWTGYHHIKEAEYDGSGIVPVSAIVPKFYGYYVPEKRVDTMLLSPILLFEDCGRPVDIDGLSPRNRELLFSFWNRLHNLKIVHGNVSLQNILAQPGPLSRHPLQRSWKYPSLRIINFGDAQYRKNITVEEWRIACFHELENAKNLIYGPFIMKQVTPGYEVWARMYWNEHEDVYKPIEC